MEKQIANLEFEDTNNGVFITSVDQFSTKVKKEFDEHLQNLDQLDFKDLPVSLIYDMKVLEQYYWFLQDKDERF